jgi:transposase-like protein
MDETYVKVKGVWKYLYRAVDKADATVNFLLTAKRDRKAAKRDRILQVNQAMTEDATPQVTLAAIGPSGQQLLRLRGIGPETASVLILEASYRKFANRREMAAYSGLTPSPGRVAVSMLSRASPKPATVGCARR